jgi:uncharacterized protein (DUF58 family)
VSAGRGRYGPERPQPRQGSGFLGRGPVVPEPRRRPIDWDQIHSFEDEGPVWSADAPDAEPRQRRPEAQAAIVERPEPRQRPARSESPGPTTPRTAAPARARPSNGNGRAPIAIPAKRAQTTPDLVLQRLEWKVIRRLDGLLQGDYRSLFHGNGIDFAGLREYQPGDDVRYIDWNVTARLDAPYVREYNEDREITAWFLLDLSPSVDFGSLETERVKREVLIDFVATLARILTRRGNKVGAIFHGEKIQQLPTGHGRDQVLRLIDTLTTQPRSPRSHLTDLEPILSAAEHVIKRRSLVFVVSDFIASPGWERPLGLLNRRHEVMAVRLTDPREMQIPDAGLLVIEDSETGEQLFVNTHDRKFRERFEIAAAEREQRVAASFRHAGVEALSLSTDEDLVRAIVRMATLRSRRRR